MPSERLTAERLAELEREYPHSNAFGITNGHVTTAELRTLVATARRAARYEAVLVEIAAMTDVTVSISRNVRVHTIARAALEVERG